MSSVHGVVVAAAGLHVMFTDNRLYTDGYKFESDGSLLCVNIVVGYLISDLYLGITHMDWPGSYMMLFHHALGIFSMIYTAVYHFGTGMVVCIVVVEATSPFVNFRWFFEKSGLKTSAPMLYLVNGAMITLSWFVLRICFYGWVIVHFVLLRWSELMAYRNPLHSAVVVVGLAGGYLLQVMWFKKIVAGMMKALAGPSKKIA